MTNCMPKKEESKTNGGKSKGKGKGGGKGGKGGATRQDNRTREKDKQGNRDGGQAPPPRQKRAGVRPKASRAEDRDHDVPIVEIPEQRRGGAPSEQGEGGARCQPDEAGFQPADPNTFAHVVQPLDILAVKVSWGLRARCCSPHPVHGGHRGVMAIAITS